MKPKTRLHNREVVEVVEEAEAEAEAEEIDQKKGGMMTNFYSLPEGCVANIIALTSPRDACRSSAVSSMFESAAVSDFVWERFLPSDYEEIISRSSSGSRSSSSGHRLTFSSKKELYFYLCDHPILIDGGTKSFRVDRSSGKKIYMIGARELSIVWGGTPQYWRWTSLPEARFPEVAELVRVCWLEIKGKMDTRMLSPETAYTAYLVMKSVEGAYGFEHPPAEASVKITSTNTDITTIKNDVDGVDWWMANDQGGRSVYLDRACAMRRHFQLAPVAVAPQAIRNKELARYGHSRPTLFTRWDIAGLVQFPVSRGDGWMEVEMGEIYIEGGDKGDVQMSLTEIKGGHWKAGLIVQGIELRPKNN
ncbi:hypothetical protein Sjap_008450 [Stephania japonica]|uniref:Uncharacterized protein n=1 Tax=Stephania japonica TaxID=461633 RepID=A0AAP0JPI5_9MAGN